MPVWAAVWPLIVWPMIAKGSDGGTMLRGKDGASLQGMDATLTRYLQQVAAHSH